MLNGGGSRLLYLRKIWSGRSTYKVCSTIFFFPRKNCHPHLFSQFVSAHQGRKIRKNPFTFIRSLADEQKLVQEKNTHRPITNWRNDYVWFWSFCLMVPVVNPLSLDLNRRWCDRSWCWVCWAGGAKKPLRAFRMKFESLSNEQRFQMSRYGDKRGDDSIYRRCTVVKKVEPTIDEGDVAL